MGWRRGHSIKSSKTSSLYDAHREARKAFLTLSDDAKPPVVGPEHAKVLNNMAYASDLPSHGVSQFHKSTPVYVLNPKQDMHGLGYDPFKGAPEFRENKRAHLPGNKGSGHKKQPPKKDGLFSFKSRSIAPGFGIGTLEELDAEDEDVCASNYEFEAFVKEIEEPTKLAIKATGPIGVRLMLKMGWRRGHSIKSSKTSSLYDARREARKADDAKPPVVGPEHANVLNNMAYASDLPSHGVTQFHKSTPVYVLN
ncbi:hypothetical protein L2E82_51152 [Cichorium intybus]|nr:hypothetical protein L2E82_51152 [Cichorium intybus]